MKKASMAPPGRRISAERNSAIGIVGAVVLKVINRDPTRAYGSAITDQVSRVVGRDLADAQIYVALRRLEERGFIGSRVEIPKPSKKSRGHPRKYYALTASGRRALDAAGVYFSSLSPFIESTSRGKYEGDNDTGGPLPDPVLI